MMARALFIHNATGSRLYRIIPQAKYLANQGWDTKVRGLKHGKTGGIPGTEIRWADIVICEMLYSTDFVRVVKKSGAKIVYELDDLMEKVPKSHYAHADMNWWRTFKTYHTLWMVDAVTCTVPALKKHYRWFNKNIHIFPNYFDMNFWEKPYLPNTSDEIRLGWTGGNCFDDRTEVLTDKGWKLFKDLDKTEKIATLNPTNEEIEYQRPTNYFEDWYEGKMAKIEMMHIDLLTTPNHKLLYAKKGGLKKDLEYKLEEAKKVFGKGFHLKKNGIWRGKNKEHWTLPSQLTTYSDDREPKKYPEVKFEIDDWLKFFGFWVADGWTSTSTHEGYPLMQVGVAQSKGDGCPLEEIRQIMSRYGFNGRYTKDKGQLRFCDKQLWKYLRQFGGAHEKFIPQDIKSLPPDKLSIFLKWYLRGDGCLSGNRKRAYTSSKMLADDLQEIGLKVGVTSNIRNRGKRKTNFKCNHDQYTVSFPKTFLKPYVRPKFQKWVDYKGKIYCVEVPNHIIYVRRNGKPVWSGNSHKEDLEFIAPVIKRVLGKYQNVKFVCCGFGGPSSAGDWVEFNYGTPIFGELPEEQYEFSLGAPMEVWPSKLASLRLDIGIAPVVEYHFSRCKSECKFGEYSLNRIPGVFQRFLYKSVKEGETGLTAGKDPDEWFEKICFLIDNEEKRKQIAENARAWVKRHWDFQDHAHKWAKLYNSLLADK
jgi:hypothetical protein